jgi:peptidoglycan/LPS O-acetylase OafA/YrhL
VTGTTEPVGGAAAPRRRRALRAPTLAECLARRRDNFLALRMIAAILVVLGHCYALSAPGNTERDPGLRLLGHTYTHLAGVMMFFAISGHLVTLSWQRRPDLARFLRARALRILPALATCVVLTAFVFGPLLTGWPIAAYLADAQPYRYVAGNATLLSLQWFLPGVFTENPVSPFVNSSLWTLPVEALLYLVVAACGVLGLLRGRRLANLAILALVGVFLAWPLARGDLGIDRMLMAFFAFGALMCVNRDHVPVAFPVLAALAFAGWALHDTAAYRYLLAAAIAYGAFWLAYGPRIPWPSRIGDWSYGTYLWAFPVEQAVLALTPLREPLALFAATLPPTLLLAALSWHFVEQPALRRKPLWQDRAP